MMIIAFPTANGGLEDIVIPSFGRSPKFTVVNLDDSTKEIKEVRIIDNPNAGLPSAAGIQTASFLASLGVNVVISPSVGPRASSILAQAGITIYIGQGKVGDLIQAFISGKLSSAPAYSQTFGPGYGRGPGRGFGRGFGGGYGRGQGPGQGWGRGQGGRW